MSTAPRAVASAGGDFDALEPDSPLTREDRLRAKAHAKKSIAILHANDLAKRAEEARRELKRVKWVPEERARAQKEVDLWERKAADAFRAAEQLGESGSGRSPVDIELERAAFWEKAAKEERRGAERVLATRRRISPYWKQEHAEWIKMAEDSERRAAAAFKAAEKYEKEFSG